MAIVECIHIGTELLTFKINSHTPFIAKKLAPLGLKVKHAQIVGDGLKEIEDSLRLALSRSDIVLASGGLGPTFDDITREAASAVLKRKLLLNKTLNQSIQKRFQKINFKTPSNNQKQAMVLEGALILKNDTGTASGQLIEVRRKALTKKILILLPGPPRELENTLDKALPYLKKHFPQKPFKMKTFKIAGKPESYVDEKIKPLLAGLPEKFVESTILDSTYVIDLIFKVGGNLIDSTTEKIRKELIKTFGEDYLGEDSATLESTVGTLLAKSNKTLSVAESCTGGLLAHRVTNISGSSVYFLNSMVNYSDDSKINSLGVKVSTLRQYGAVSEAVAEEMALSIMKQSGSDFGLSVTGICGPSGAVERKPVGLAWFALAQKHQKVATFEKIFFGDRAMLKEKMASFALDILRRRLL